MSDSDELDDYRWLVSVRAERWLRVASDAGLPLHRRTMQLRQSLTPARTHLVLQQAGLRGRADDKFCPCGRLFLTPSGLEQATDQWIAAYKAGRFPPQQSVIDLCCGIGGDLMGLSRRGSVTGYDCDPVAALFASENLRRQADNGARARVSWADARSADLGSCAAWHIDPDRRDGRRRTVNPAFMAPPGEAIERLLAINGNAAIKLAPATRPPREWQERAELEWISRARECRQLVAWFGCLTDSPGLRRATVLSPGGSILGQVRGTPQPLPGEASSVLDYVCEPDPAVLAAGLAGHAAHVHGLRPLARDIPYFTSDKPVSDPAITSFRVEDVLPFDERRLASALRSHGIGEVEIKHRGVKLVPERLRRRLRLAGERSGVVLVAPHAGRNVALIATRLQG